MTARPATHARPRTPPRTLALPALAGAISAGLLLAVVGCSSGSGARATPTVTLRASDFASTATSAPAATPAPRRTDQALDINAPRADTRGQTPRPGTPADIVATPGAPVLGAGDPPPAGPPVLVDAKIGDVNGNPVYASTFFEIGSATLEPLGPRLAAEARRRSPESWVAFARQEINERLDLFVRDELLRGEALASIDPQMKQGLFAFVRSLQEDQRRAAGGSVEALSRDLQEREGLTLDQWARRQEQEQLIRLQIQQKILRRINVSWRDIEQAYNGRFADLYKHPPRYRFYLINVPASATEDVANLQSALGSGRPFPELAALPLNRFRNDRAGLEIREHAGDPESATFFPNPRLNEVARALAPGQTGGPVDLAGTLAWVHLERIDLPAGLYEAQLDVEQRLRMQRFNELTSRYLERLIGRSSVTSIAEMRTRLLAIAVERYAPRPSRAP